MKPGRWIALCVLPCVAFGQPHWVKMPVPTTRNLSRVSFIDSVQGWVAGDSGVVCHTTDGGQTWVKQETGVSNSLFDLFILDRSYGWAVGLQYAQDTSWYGTVLIRTTNGGATWTRRNLQGEYFYTIMFFDSVNGWMAGHNGKVRKTTDGGSSWVPAPVDSSIVSGFPINHLDFYSRNYGFGLGGRVDAAGVIWRTTNGGARWAAVDPGGDGEPLHGLHYIDSLHVIAVGGDFDLGSGIIRTKDGGETWQYTFLRIWGEARALAFRTPAEGYVPLGFPGTYMSTKDTGETWASYETADSQAVFDVKFPDSLHGYMVGANGSVLKYVSQTDAVSPDPANLPEGPALLQNFPNPFNPVTKVVYRLPVAGTAILKVYDVLGREVATLFDGRETAGTHEAEFSCTDCSSGVYYCRLTAISGQGITTQVRKMLLLR